MHYGESLKVLGEGGGMLVGQRERLPLPTPLLCRAGHGGENGYILRTKNIIRGEEPRPPLLSPK